MYARKTGLSVTALVGAFLWTGSLGCKGKKSGPSIPVPDPILNRAEVAAAKKAVHTDLAAASKALCRRKPLFKGRPGDGTKELAAILADERALDACVATVGPHAPPPSRRSESHGQVAARTNGQTHQTGKVEAKASEKDRQAAGAKDQRTGRAEAAEAAPPALSPCDRIWKRLSRALSHESICSPFAMTVRSGDRPPKVSQAVRFTDMLLADTSRLANRNPRLALRRLVLVAMLLEDLRRGAVDWTTAVTLTNLWPKLADLFALLVAKTKRLPENMPRLVTRLQRQVPGIRSVLLGEHLRRLAAAGLLSGRVDLSVKQFPALDMETSNALDARALADHRDLALLLARHCYRRSLAECRAKSLSVCQAALHKIEVQNQRDQRLEELHRMFLVRFQKFGRFRNLVMRTVAPKGEKKLTEDEASARYWAKLLAWSRAWDEKTLPLLARSGFYLAAMGYHLKVKRFVLNHPTRAIYSQVASFVFSFSEPYSGKPILARPNGHDVEVTPPPQAATIKVSPYVIRLKHRGR